MKPTANQIICGSNIDVVKPWPANCIDSVITDAPYELGFMSKNWDSTGIAYSVPMWKQMLRITKPGGFLLCFGGTRTYHRLACAIEDAGWEIRDCMMWLYGCLSEDTEILTKKGWKPLHKTTKYDKIRVYDIAANIYKWETPQRWNVYRVHKDTAYRIKSDTTDQIVSREHRCLVERNGELVFKQAWELSEVERMPVLPQDFHSMGERFRDILFSFLQWENKSKKSHKVQQQYERAGTERQKIWLQQSCLKRWSNLFQKKGKLWQIQNKICQMSRKIFSYGSQRWLRYGTSPIGSPTNKQTSFKNGGCSSQRPQSRKQFTGQSSTFQNKQSPQIARVEVSQIEYSGLMFCPTVSTRAFVARRKGKVFITGNSGFPKSHNISKAIDKAAGATRKILEERHKGLHSGGSSYQYSQMKNETGNCPITAPATDLAQLWNGYGTALKPAWEPIIVAMKPLDGTFAHNAERHGVAGLNIDGGRIGTEIISTHGSGDKYANLKKGKSEGVGEYREHQGRWPANLILDEEVAEGESWKRYFYCAKTSKKERNIGMENCEDKPRGPIGKDLDNTLKGPTNMLRKDKPTLSKNNHPTVKPLALMKYLCTLLKMPSADQIILDPFLGSGTTGMACASLGIDFIGIEKEPEYCKIASKRISAITGKPLSVTLPVTKNIETFNKNPLSPRQRIINAAVAKVKNRK